MSAADHPAYPEEGARLSGTLALVAATLDATLRRKNDLDQEIRRLDRACTDDNSQAFIDLMVKTNLQSGLALRLRNLHEAKRRPYFARIDFREDGAAAAERLYLGKMCLMRDDDQTLVIVDWRAPVADLYYEGRLGRAAYRCPAGEIAGELTLKRQFSIAGGALERIADIDVTTTDEFLGACLGATAQNRLKEIVATIQAEQNRIIRAPQGRHLLIQGAAGSGKTTIALHRIAYLIYDCGESFQPEEFMIIAPNRLFLNYISEVLPELGVERVRQATFEDFAREVIGLDFTVADANEKLLLFLEAGADEAERHRRGMLREAAAYKSSLVFKDLLEGYIAGLERDLLPEADLRLGDLVFVAREEIQALYYENFRNWPAFQRLTLMRKHLEKRVRERKQAFIAGLQAACDADVAQIKAAMEESEVRRLFILEKITRKEEAAARIEAFAADCVPAYLSKLPRRNVLDYYRDFWSAPGGFPGLAAGLVEDGLRRFMSAESLNALTAGRVENEDIAALVYLKYRLFGLDEQIRLRHLVLDEAQDFSVFQLYALRRLIKDCSFTVLGDLAQGIHAYRGLRDWEEARREVFGEGGSDYLTLEQSYRTTVEIMNAANRVLSHRAVPGIPPAKPVLRHGQPVKPTAAPDAKAVAREIRDRIETARHSGYSAIAVIAKTPRACAAWRERLEAQGLDAPVITGKETEYVGGLVIVPAYLAKGLEFDVVFILDADRERYRLDELDAKLLYVAMTRALHELHIYYCGEPSPLLA